MSNFIRGKNLQIAVSLEALKIIGKSDGNGKLENFIEEMFKNLLDNVSHERKEEIIDIIPYICNVVFLPDIIPVMIEKDILFNKAVALCHDGIQEMWLYYQNHLEQMKENEESNAIMTIFLEEIIQVVKGIILDKNSICGVLIQDVSVELSWAIAYTGLTAIMKNISDNVRTTLEKKLEPVRESMYSYVNEVQNRLKLDDEKIEILISEVDSIIEANYENIPIQTVLSEVIKKSIDKDITFLKASHIFDATKFTEMFIEELERYNEFNTIAISFKYILNSELKSFGV